MMWALASTGSWRRPGTANRAAGIWTPRRRDARDDRQQYAAGEHREDQAGHSHDWNGRGSDGQDEAGDRRDRLPPRHQGYGDERQGDDCEARRKQPAPGWASWVSTEQGHRVLQEELLA